MTRLTIAKLALGVAGLLVFGYGVRIDDPIYRWIGVALVAIAWLLRLGNPKGSGRGRGRTPRSPDGE